MGTALAELGNVYHALTQYTDALEIARARAHEEDQAIVLNNMGTALNYASLYRDAIPCFETSLALFRPTWKSTIAKKSATNLAQSLYYLERFDEALDTIWHALETHSSSFTTSEHFDEALREFTVVQIALELDRTALAQEHSAKCHHHAIAAKSISRTLMARIASARCQVRTGDTKKGLNTLDQLVMECMKIDSMYKDALIAAVKAHDEAGDPQGALSYMERLLAHTRERKVSTVHALLASPLDMVDMVGSPQTQFDLGTLEKERADLRSRVAEHKAIMSRLEMLERLAVTADIREESSGEHGYRVGRLAALLASHIGWSKHDVEVLELAARLHDIGKIGVPDKILGSCGGLKGEEQTFMRMHTEIGAELLSNSDLPDLKIAKVVARHHHERWDGTGYPDKLTGRRIPIHARIVALADVWDALTHGRPYADPWPEQAAMDELTRQRGSQFDPNLSDAFLTVISRLKDAHPNLDKFLSDTAPTSSFLEVRRKVRSLLERGQRRLNMKSLH